MRSSPAFTPPLGERAAFVFIPHGGTAAAIPFAEGNDFALAFGPVMERAFVAAGVSAIGVGGNLAGKDLTRLDEDGRATYRNRFVRTHCFEAEQIAGQSLWGGLMDPWGTSVRPGFGARG